VKNLTKLRFLEKIMSPVTPFLQYTLRDEKILNPVSELNIISHNLQQVPLGSLSLLIDTVQDS
jgi:hypothetical protein